MTPAETPLAAWRRRAGLTRKAFAAQLGLSALTLWRYERKGQVPKPAILARIREATGGALRPEDFYPASRGAKAVSSPASDPLRPATGGAA